MDIGINFKTATKNFFDAEKIEDHIAAGERQILSKFGAYVRRRSRQSLRKRRKIAEPGSPPSVHSTGPMSLKNILFFADKESVIIGPVLLRRGTALRAQEHGGQSVLIRRPHSKRPQPLTVTIRAHPFMHPAGEYERLHSLPAMFKDAF